MKNVEIITPDDLTIGLIQRSFSRFVVSAWPIVESSTPLVPGWHVDAICQHLEAVTRGEIRNLVINMPPRHMKSLLVSVFWPCWDWITFPERRWIFASYAQGLATRDSVKCRRLIQSRWYRSSFGDSFSLTKDQNQKTRFDNDQSGFRLATSVGGLGTGEGGDRIVVDDPHNVMDAESDRRRTKALRWWDETMASRGNDPKTNTRVIVMQRVHQDDLTGHVLAQGGYEHLCLPAEYEGSKYVTSIGWRDPRTKLGDLLCPARFGADELAELKLRLGSRASAGQLQQRPAPVEGAIFKSIWFSNRYKDLPIFTRVATFWDTALKAKEENDETASVTVGAGKDGNLYLLRCRHGRMETPDVVKLLVDQSNFMKKAFGTTYVGDYVEDKVSGTTLMQYVRQTRPDLIVIPIHVEADKISRAHGVTPLCESGRVLLPDPAEHPEARQWVDDLLTALLSFPASKHDDLTDAFVYALKWYTGSLTERVSKRGRGGMV